MNPRAEVWLLLGTSIATGPVLFVAAATVHLVAALVLGVLLAATVAFVLSSHRHGAAGAAAAVGCCGALMPESGSLPGCGAVRTALSAAGRHRVATSCMG